MKILFFERIFNMKIRESIAPSALYPIVEDRVMKFEDIPTSYFIKSNGEVYNQYHKLVNPVVRAGRPYIDFNINNMHYCKRLDYLVADNFSNRPNDPIRLVHRDGDNFNCCIDNLYWISRQDIIDQYRDDYKIDENIAFEEIWRELDTPRGPLLISSFGRVREYKDSSKKETREVPIHNSHGYRVIYYIEKDTDAKKTKVLNVHQLVAQAFIPNPHGYRIVNHLDGDKDNCHVYNLEWCDISMNTEHGYLINNGGDRFEEDKLDMIGRLLQEGKLKHVDIAKITGVDRKTISDIYRGRRHKYLSKKYDFVPKKWNDETKQTIINLHNQGYTRDQIRIKMNLENNDSTNSYIDRVRRENRDQLMI